jgi:hypothetical protein
VQLVVLPGAAAGTVRIDCSAHHRWTIDAP